ncbi:MAG TPA: 3'(2'),5'-bisphosphate nucleotidase CysQ [Stellaceae bacterium]|nr:3'(2'),5'-bisphosphate nucleotidase CysQ [Stellaceae bacterium]
MEPGLRELVEAARRAARAASAAILEIYATPFDVRRKEDLSPVTEADERAERIIIEALRDAAPGIPAIAEELAAAQNLPALGPRFWLIDPLDGTKEFIAKNDEFSVNIGLIEGDRPVLGVIHAPVANVTYAAAGLGSATRQEGDNAPVPITARKPPARGLVVAHSRSHAASQKLAAFLADYPNAKRRISGSAIKFCFLAEGSADLYPRFGTTMEWDTAAGQAILEAAGGSVTTLDGAPLRYGKPLFRNPGFIARGR